MNPERHIPVASVGALQEAEPEARRRYAAYLYDRGYTLQSMGDAVGVTRQAIAYAIRNQPTSRPEGMPAVPRVGRRGHDLPALSREQSRALLRLWVLGRKYRRDNHADDSPWAVASRQFMGEVLVLQSQGYLPSEIARDLGIQVDALYRRLRRDEQRREREAS